MAAKKKKKSPQPPYTEPRDYAVMSFDKQETLGVFDGVAAAFAYAKKHRGSRVLAIGFDTTWWPVRFTSGENKGHVKGWTAQNRKTYFLLYPTPVDVETLTTWRQQVRFGLVVWKQETESVCGGETQTKAGS